ncbi:hypothetical protein Tco_0557225 [Tanacetum coccineum]
MKKQSLIRRIQENSNENFAHLGSFSRLSLDESRSPVFDLFSDLEENSKEEVAETMAKSMEEYMSKTRAGCGSSLTRPKIDDKDHFELKADFSRNYETTPSAVQIMKMLTNILRKFLRLSNY